MKSVHCEVAKTSVFVVTDLDGEITRVVCPEYERSTGVCRLRKDALRGGALSQLLNRLAEDTLDSRTTRCELH